MFFIGAIGIIVFVGIVALHVSNGQGGHIIANTPKTKRINITFVLPKVLVLRLLLCVFQRNVQTS